MASAGLLRLGILSAAASFCAPSLPAQLSKLDGAAKAMAARLEALQPNPALLKVADLAEPDGSHSAQSHYFAWYYSGSLKRYGKKYGKEDFLSVGDHLQFDDDLARIRNPLGPVWTAEAVRIASPQISADYVVLGSLQKKNSSFFVLFTAVRVNTGAVIDSQAIELHTSEFLESLSSPAPEIDGTTTYRAGVDGVGMPSCIKCPDPGYSDTARAARIEGKCVLLVVVSAAGTAGTIHIEKLVGYGLDEVAFNTIKTWKFKPALDQSGNAVSTVVPVEVTFRLF